MANDSPMSSISLSKKIMTLEETRVDVTDAIDADFWNCYMCDMEGKCIKVLYDTRKAYRDGLWEDKPTQLELNKKRDELRSNVDNLLKECAENKLALCVILGCNDFRNFYYYPNTDGTFECIDVTFVRE
jgi:hypothetical protein